MQDYSQNFQRDSHHRCEKEWKNGGDYHYSLSLSWSRDHFNKPSSISPISPQRLAAVSTRGRGGRSFPTRFFVSLRTIVRNCHSIASPPPREGFVNEPRMERDRLKERERERETTSGEGELSILGTWAFIDNPMAEGEVKRSGTAYRLDSTRVRRSAFRSLVSSRTRWRIYPFPRRMNSCSFVSKIWGNGVDVVRLTKLNESEKQDNIEFIYIFLFAEAHIYTISRYCCKQWMIHELYSFVYKYYFTSL